MAKVVWSHRASTDIVRTCEYLERDSPAYANWFGQKFWATLEAAAEQPYVGAMVLEYGEEKFRERRVDSYRLMYEVHRDAIYVVAIRHGARQLPSNRRDLSE
jgi:toxin ParE1/3/4